MFQIRLAHTVLIALFVLALLPKAYSHENKIAVFVDNSYPPYMYELDETKAEGLYPRLLKEVIHSIGHKPEILAVPWKRALIYGDSGLGAVGGAYKNNERLERYDFSAPLYQEKMVVFVNKDKLFSYNDLNDLADKTIGVNRGWSYGQKFDEARDAQLFKVNVRGNPAENFKMLALGRIDCVILDQLSGESYIRLLGMNDKLIALPTPFSLNNGYLMISKELNMKSFLKKFDSHLSKMRADGRYNEIVDKFILGTIAKPDPDQKVSD